MQNGKEVIAYFTPEFALDQKFPTYSGGLGVVSGDLLRSAKKLGLPVVGVSILPTEGYYDQYITPDNLMGIKYVKRYYDDIKDKLKDTDILFPITICGSSVYIKVKYLSESAYNNAPVIFLTTDISENDALSRTNTLQLYGGSSESGSNPERKVAQFMVLGIGGVEALRRLGYKVGLYHLNEGHTGFAAIYLLYENLRNKFSSIRHINTELKDAILKVATAETRSQIVFTTHTPVDAGHQRFELEMFMRMIGMKDYLTSDILRKIGIEPRYAHMHKFFDMTTACLKLSHKTNAVSKRHLETIHEQFAHISQKSDLVYVTNGVSRDFWQAPEFRAAQNWEELTQAKLKYTRESIRYLNEKHGVNLDESIPILVWARRWAEYKRPGLLFWDMEWFKSLLFSNSVQVIYAGKPHPDDKIMIDLFNRVLWLSTQFPNLYVLAGYELELNKKLKQLSHIWLNSPRAPMEASGTSGMSAAMSAAMNLSILDGWYCEANAENCFIFGSEDQTGKSYEQDAYDARKLQEKLPEVLESYKDREGWYRKCFNAKLEAEEHWTSDRMVRQYAERLYGIRLR